VAQEFDPIAFKKTTRQQRQKAASAWQRPTLQAWLGPVTDATLDLAKLQPGDCVRDLAPNSVFEYKTPEARGTNAWSIFWQKRPSNSSRSSPPVRPAAGLVVK